MALKIDYSRGDLLLVPSPHNFKTFLLFLNYVTFKVLKSSATCEATRIKRLFYYISKISFSWGELN